MATKAKKAATALPSRFKALTRSRIDGWFIVEAGNQVIGILRDVFEVPDRFKKGGSKRVYKIEVTEGETRCTDPDGAETSLTEGLMVGLDEKGFLSPLADVPKGTEVCVVCAGRAEKANKPGQQPAWLFEIGTV
jgi:hypothetical protein